MTMRIGINTLPLLGKSGASGVGRYIRSHCLALARLPLDHQYVLLGETIEGWAAGENWIPVATHPYLRRPKLRFLARLLAENSQLPYLADKLRLDLLHYTELSAPLPPCPCPVISMIYDLKFRRFPELYIPAARHYFSVAVGHAVRKAARILTCSTSTKNDLIEYYQVPPQAIEVIYGGVDPRFRPLPKDRALEQIATRFALHFPYVLFVGMLEPAKNLPALIRAFAGAKRRHGFPHHLVLAGNKGWLWEDIPQTIANQNAEKMVVLLGHVPEDLLVPLYNAADLFVFPSLYEGFGLPVLEAMACGTPVITSNVSSLPEVAGAAAILIDPSDSEALSAAIGDVLSNPELAHTLREAGKKQAVLFKWEAVAQRTVAAYQHVFGS